MVFNGVKGLARAEEEGRQCKLKSAKVQIGAELLCKGGKVDDKITEYRGRKYAKAVQLGLRPVEKWKGGCSQSTEFRVRSTEELTKGTGWLEYGV